MTIIRTEKNGPDCHIVYEGYGRIIKWAVYQNEHDSSGNFIKWLK